MRLALLFATCLLFSAKLSAQYENANLLVQSPDGKTVKLVWFLKTWNREITGFDIKRKEGMQDWVKLNREPITPGISGDKDLSIVESDKASESAIKDKAFKLIRAKKMPQLSDSALLQRLNADDKALHDISDLMSHDYDLALISGFAYVDHTVTKKTDYEYGVFIAGTGKMLDSVLWNYGQIPDLNAVTEITSKANVNSSGIEIIWNADMARVKTGDIAGFNIYREGLRLNSIPISAVNTRDPSEYRWFDKTANSSVSNHYSISAESLFGIEGIIKSYTYNPADHPLEYEKAEVKEITSLGYYFKEGISIRWDFPKGFDHFLKGFYVEKDNMPEGYKQVSSLLDPSARSFVDKTPSPVTGYIRFRVIAVYEDKTIEPGIEKLYNYFPLRDCPMPQNLHAKGSLKDKRFVINLTWDPRVNGDTITDHYKIWFNDPVSGSFRPITDNPIRTNSYTYSTGYGTSYVFKFCLSAVSKAGNETAITDTVTVQAPSMELPVPLISKAVFETDKAVVEWQYTDVADLKGFRLFQNNVQIAGEDELKRTDRKFVTPALPPGVSYTFTIQAVSQGGVVSPVSLPALVSVPPPPSHKK